MNTIGYERKLSGVTSVSLDGFTTGRTTTGKGGGVRTQVPIVLGRGVRLWDGLEALEAAYNIGAPTPSGVTHLTFTRP